MRYEKCKLGYKVVSVDRNAKIVKIPKHHRFRKVVTIGARSFLNCNVEFVLLPDSIIRIERESFKNCEKLETLCIPTSLKVIGNAAFENCKSLDFFGALHTKLKIVGSNAFHNCTGLKHVWLPNTVTEMGARAFKNCENLLVFHNPKNNLVIENETFSNCKKLESVYLQSDISIAVNAFEGSPIVNTEEVIM